MTHENFGSEFRLLEIGYWAKEKRGKFPSKLWSNSSTNVMYLFGGLGTLSNIFQRGFKKNSLKSFFLNTLIDNGFHTSSMVRRQLGKPKGSDIRF